MKTFILYVLITAIYALYLSQTDLKQKAGKIMVEKEESSDKFILPGICLISLLWPYLLLRRGWRKASQKILVWHKVKQHQL
ncbi:hypothetical protein [Desulfogranum marinum]|uniref:hypothetical protein n=1 Tax=Desulfogranum marinum TaxID=453220 RepID=UPI0029C99E69|nr:hypothetical protein [Desulfogranum marinum]